MIAGGHVTLAVTDLGRAIRFYVETLGMKLVAQDERAASIDAGEGFIIALMSGRQVTGPTGHRQPALAQSVPDAMVGLRAKSRMEDVVAVLENRGIVFVVEDCGDTGGGVRKRAHFRDVDGNDLYLYET
jgi:catechol 2,3-dioxygenase-like lactoylglutathione lyase family enzyme